MFNCVYIYVLIYHINQYANTVNILNYDLLVEILQVSWRHFTGALLQLWPFYAGHGALVGCFDPTHLVNQSCNEGGILASWNAPLKEP